MEHYQAPTSKFPNNYNHSSTSVSKQTSMNTLVIWNVMKALEKNPSLNLKNAIKTTQERLERDSHDINAIISQYPEERHLACAFLAWQQLGHKNVDSLCQFVEANRKESACSSNQLQMQDEKSTKGTFRTPPKRGSFISYSDSRYSKGIDSPSFDTYSFIGPVVKLPVDTKIVMRMDSIPNASKKQKSKDRNSNKDKDVMSKIDACCMDSACVERLTQMDSATNELRLRAGRLAKREAERVELLERAEAAWRDLELGYQRRLRNAEEKEENMKKKIQSLIDDRNAYREVCSKLAQQLKEKGEAAESSRVKLTNLEKEVYGRACVRLRLSQEAAKGDATLAEQQCIVSQLDRDLQFKQEQARRKLLNMESEVDSARVLTHEAELALRAELSALKEQITVVSDQLLGEDAETGRIRKELDDLRQEKMEIVEDLEGCKLTCENRMGGVMENLKKKKTKLAELKEKVLECRCKVPVDATVEVKRTPSLAALCRCTPEDKVLESCSCTSLRSRLLSNLLADLFGGLQAELPDTGVTMSCQLLTCLDDKHNWDRASLVKTNLRNFFSRLLVGELNIAIATSIEKYHAKWVGTSCADDVKMIPDPGENLDDGWQERAIERKAQSLATKLAEKLFQEKAEQLAQKAKDIAIASGPPPCECKSQQQQALFPCLVKPTPMVSASNKVNSSKEVASPDNWLRTQQNVTQLRVQIEELKKKTVKKEDLRVMEEKITQIVKRIPEPGKIKYSSYEEKSSKENKNIQYGTDQNSKPILCKSTISKKKQMGNQNISKNANKIAFISTGNVENNSGKLYKKLGQSFAVNLCLCETQKKSTIKKAPDNAMFSNICDEKLPSKKSWKENTSKDIMFQTSNIKQTKPIKDLPSETTNIAKNKTKPSELLCHSKCVCFHKKPSNSSINKLLDNLEKWKSELQNFEGVQNVLDDHDNTDIQVPEPNIVCKENDAYTNIESSNKSNDEHICIVRTQSKKKIDLFNNLNDDKEILKSMTCGRILTIPTESEHMATVSLDKSNENICRCLNKNFDEKSGETVCMYQTKDTGLSFKCISAGVCNCKKNISLTLNTNLKTLTQNQTVINTSSHTNIHSNDQKQVVTPIVINNEPSAPNINNITELIKTSQLLPRECDYHVRFLGVTLANTDKYNSNKKDVNNINFNGEHKKRNLDNNAHKNNLKCEAKETNKTEVLTTFETIYSPAELNISHPLEKENTVENSLRNELYKNMSIIQDNSNFEESNHFYTNTYNTEADNIEMTKDKALDTKKIEGNKLNEPPEPCICCNTNTIDESKDLELNTFHLLEEHLKSKLEEFKQSSCKSSCIDTDNEVKLYSTILERVKKIILDNTDKLSCKCSARKANDGTWNRAYSLLQEYLKSKITRVQCLCVSPDETKESSLPIILNKVCNLIENDFERLKDICKCKNIKEFGIENIYKYNTYFDAPEKDMNSNKSNNNQDFQSDNLYTVKHENMSSQVSSHLYTKTKSCSVIETGSKTIQTIDDKDTCTIMYCNDSKTKSCCTCNVEDIKKPHIQIFGDNDILVNQSLNLDYQLDNSIKCAEKIYNTMNSSDPINLNEIDSIQNNNSIIKQVKSDIIRDNSNDINNVKHLQDFPYIGYTIDCSCDRDVGGCVCTKALTRANEEKINDLWKKFTTEKMQINNVSYIMDNIYNKGIQNGNTESHVCETDINDDIKNGIVLKDSTIHLDKINTTTNTVKELYPSFTKLDDIFEWYDCTSQNNVIRKHSAKSELANCNTKSSQHCDCDVVPVCHVKMLVDSIENKLVHCKCTCDSMSSKVCPVHSKTCF